MSFTTAGGRNKPVYWQSLDGWVEVTSYLLLRLYRVWYDACLAVPVHMIHDSKGHRRITYWFSAEQLRMSCLQWHLVKFARWYGGESYADRAGALEDLLPSSEAWSSVGTTGDCLVMSGGAHWTRNSDKLRCLRFCSWVWVSLCIIMNCVCECVCVCVCVGGGPRPGQFTQWKQSCTHPTGGWLGSRASLV
jgi:hypothetical protein